MSAYMAWEDRREADRLGIPALKAGTRVTCLVPAGRGLRGQEYKEATGRLVMIGPAGYVLNMGRGMPHVATPGTVTAINGRKV